MELRITIDVFSGRENPVVVLTGKQATQALDRVRPARRIERGEPGGLPESFLGYRGLVIEQVSGRDRKLPRTFRLAHGSLMGPKLAHKAQDETFEEYICSTQGPFKKAALGRSFFKVLEPEIARSRASRLSYAERRVRVPMRTLCRWAPLYEPNWWNDGAQKELQNNCYNYGCDHRTDTFRMESGGGQPGAAADAIYTAITSSAVTAAAQADGLIDRPNANNKWPNEGHLVALVIWPGHHGDFHWYRKGRTGAWSHKPGSTPVTHLDNSGAAILDPRKADRGPYTEFATFMVVMHGHIKVK